MKHETVKVEAPKDCNLILGQAHFIKTVEDLYEAMVSATPMAKFGIAFCESSGPCLIRSTGNDPELQKAAAENALRIGAGHSFLIFMRNVYPINVLNAVKNVAEVCTVYCATANPVEAIIAETVQGRGILGVVDGQKPKGIEKHDDAEERRRLLRTIGYKL